MMKFKKVNFRKEFVVLFIMLVIISAILPSIANFNKVETSKVYVYFRDSSKFINISYSKDYIQKLNEYNNAFINSNRSSLYRIDITPGYGNTTSYVIALKYNASDEEKINTKNILSDYRNGLKKIDGVYSATISSLETFHYSNYFSFIYKLLGISVFLLTLMLLIGRTGLKNRLLLALVFVLPVLGVAFNFLFILTALNVSALLILFLMERNKEDAKYLIGIFSAAVLLRLLGTALMLLYNDYSFNSLFAYVQPDEINYYNTAMRISDNFLSGIIPDVYKIVGFKQFGYNLFLGVVNVINGELFFASKVINILVSGFIAVLTYLFVKEFFGSKAAKLSGFIICLMPTMIMFSTYTLRDEIIVALIMLILYLSTRKEKLSAGPVMLLAVSVISLWFLRNYAVLIVGMIVVLFRLLAFSQKRNINPFVIIGIIIAGSFAFFEVTSKVYSFNTFNTIYNYFKYTNVLSFTEEFLLSLVNLDFLVNSTAASYGKSTILRMFYPDTLFLIVTFPFYVMGIIKGFKVNKVLTIALLTMFPAFIILYKIYYGGWFLRTQIQVLPIQVAFISLGIIDVFGERYDKLLQWLGKRFPGKHKRKNGSI